MHHRAINQGPIIKWKVIKHWINDTSRPIIIIIIITLMMMKNIIDVQSQWAWWCKWHEIKGGPMDYFTTLQLYNISVSSSGNVCFCFFLAVWHYQSSGLFVLPVLIPRSSKTTMFYHTPLRFIQTHKVPLSIYETTARKHWHFCSLFTDFKENQTRKMTCCAFFLLKELCLIYSPGLLM